MSIQKFVGAPGAKTWSPEDQKGKKDPFTVFLRDENTVEYHALMEKIAQAWHARHGDSIPTMFLKIKTAVESWVGMTDKGKPFPMPVEDEKTGVISDEGVLAMGRYKDELFVHLTSVSAGLTSDEARSLPSPSTSEPDSSKAASVA